MFYHPVFESTYGCIYIIFTYTLCGCRVSDCINNGLNDLVLKGIKPVNAV